MHTEIDVCQGLSPALISFHIHYIQAQFLQYIAFSQLPQGALKMK